MLGTSMSSPHQIEMLSFFASNLNFAKTMDTKRFDEYKMQYMAGPDNHATIPRSFRRGEI